MYSQFFKCWKLKLFSNALLGLEQAPTCDVFTSTLTLLMILHDRDSRRSFTGPNHWLIRSGLLKSPFVHLRCVTYNSVGCFSYILKASALVVIVLNLLTFVCNQFLNLQWNNFFYKQINFRDVKPSHFMAEFEKEKKTALFLMQKVPHIIPFNEVSSRWVIKTAIQALSNESINPLLFGHYLPYA